MSARRQGPIELYIGLGGLTDASTFGGGGTHPPEQVIGRRKTSTIRVDGVVTRTITGTPGGESDGVTHLSFAGTFGLSRSATDIVTLDSELPEGWSVDEDGTITGSDGALYTQPDGSLTVWLRIISDEGELTGFLLGAEDASGSFGGSRNTTGRVIVERPMEV